MPLTRKIIIGLVIILVVAFVGSLTDLLYQLVEDPTKQLARSKENIIAPVLVLAYLLAAAIVIQSYEFFNIKKDFRTGAIFGCSFGGVIAALCLYDYATLDVSFALTALWMFQKVLEFSIAGALYGWMSKKFR